MKKTNIFLIGPMGAGKTTIGRLLATRLRLDFIDSDHEIQASTGVDIPTIFEFEGEQGFRERERTTIDTLTQKEGFVLATGGGVILDRENRRNLSSRGMVVYLYCSPEQQFERTRHDKNRPLIQTENPLVKLTGLFSVRDPLYREVADLIVSTEKRPASVVAREIIRKLNIEQPD